MNWLFTEGSFIIVICLFLFLSSSLTLGQASFCHSWLFTGLTVLKPADESTIALICGVSKKNNNNNNNSENQFISTTLQQQLRTISTPFFIAPGVMAKHALKSSSENDYTLWRWLDASVIFITSLLVGMLWKWAFLWMEFFFATNIDTPCGNDIKHCWYAWYTRYNYSNTTIGIFLIFAICAIWNLSCFASQIMIKSNNIFIMKYSPSCYINAFIWGIISYILLSLLCRNNNKSEGGILQLLLQLKHNNDISSSLQELSIRFILWLRLLGLFDNKHGNAYFEHILISDGLVDDNNNHHHDLQQQPILIIMNSLMQGTRFIVAGVTACFVFCSVDNISIMMKSIITQWHTQNKTILPNQSRQQQQQQSSSSLSKSERIFRQAIKICNYFAMWSLTILPVLILMSYFEISADASSLSVRYTLTWITTISMLFLIPTLLQTQLHQALPEVAELFAQQKQSTSSSSSSLDMSKIKFPFEYRFERLIRTASQLVSFPLTLVVLLLTLELCKPSSYSSGLLYPVVYNNLNATTTTTTTVANVTNNNDNDIITQWELHQAKYFAIYANERSNTISKYIFPTHANTFGMDNETIINDDNNITDLDDTNKVYCYTGPTTPIDLLIMTKPPNKTLLESIKDLQQLMKQAPSNPIIRKVLMSPSSYSKDSPEPMAAEALQALSNIKSTLFNVITFSFFTNTSIVPIIDFFLFLSCCLWVISYITHVVSYWHPIGKLNFNYIKLCCVQTDNKTD